MKHIIVTIGREYGSGGRIIAQKLADALGIRYYDKELIQDVARSTGFSEAYIQEAEKRPTGSFIYDLYTAVQPASVPDQVFIAQAKIIREAADRDSCVIVGRCADYILRDHPDCLRVFIYAPLEERVRRAREEYYAQAPNMDSFVIRQDKARASYYNYFTTGRWGDRREYDLCVNSHMGIDNTVAVIQAAASFS